MLTLRFENGGVAAHTVGPAPFFRFVGNSLRMGPQDEHVALYQGGVWETAGSLFVTITTEAPATVRFEGQGGQPAHVHGPFDVVKFVDGALRHGPTLTLLAVLDEAVWLWHVAIDQKDYPVAVLEAV